MPRAGSTPPPQFRDIDEVADLLREAGGRFSASRRIVLEALFAVQEPLAAEHIAAGSDGRTAPLDLTSVYRILERLEALGVVRHVHLGHGPGLYALTRDGGREYLVCDRCDRVTVVSPSQLDHVRARVRDDLGFEASFSHFPMVGLCAACAADLADRPGGPMTEHAHDGDHPHTHTHAHDGMTHTHPHTDHEHDHVEHAHEHAHGDVVHAHSHVHAAGLERDHEHPHD